MLGFSCRWSFLLGEQLSRYIAHGAPCLPVDTMVATTLSRTLLHLARRSDHLQACVRVASSHHIPCVPAVRLCVARPASALLALWPSCFACVRACCSVLGSPYLALSLGGGAVTEVLHDLHCGPALSLVRHDLPCKKKKKKKRSAGSRARSTRSNALARSKNT